jgi:FHS family L-fucose permease-like MFS transporter
LPATLHNISAPGFIDDTVVKTDTRAMTVTTALFFMVGFLTCLNDVVIPHLKSIFELNYAEALLVQFAFFSSYFIFSYPGGKLVERVGYKRAMVIGLLVMAAGAAGFLPAAYFALFPLFLGALILLAAGMTVVQVAVNPYVTVIGPAATASSRLNLAQAFNSVGTFIAPFVGGLLILGGATQLTPERMHSLSAAALQSYREVQADTVRLPYIAITVTLVLLAVALAAIKLRPQDSRPSSPRTSAPAPSPKRSPNPTPSGSTPGCSPERSASSPTSVPRSPSAACWSTTWACPRSPASKSPSPPTS